MRTEIQIAGITVTVSLEDSIEASGEPHLEVVQSFSSLVEGEYNEWRTCQPFSDYDYEQAKGQYEYLVDRFTKLSTTN